MKKVIYILIFFGATTSLMWCDGTNTITDLDTDIGSWVLLTWDDQLTPIQEFWWQFARENQILSLAKLDLTEFPDICSMLTQEQMWQIKSLDMHTHSIQRVDVDLSCMPLLTEIDLSFGQIQEVISFWVPLKKLFLSNNKVSSLSLLKFDSSKLESLVLSNNELQNLKWVERFDALVNLEVHHNQIASIAGIESIKTLEKIKLEFNKLDSIRILNQLPNLWFVTATYNTIPEEQLEPWVQKTKSYIQSKELE